MSKTPAVQLEELFPPFRWLRRSSPREAKGAEELWELYRAFARGYVAPRALEIDAASPDELDRAIRAVITEASRRRIFSAALPIPYGGLGLPLSGLLPALEELAGACSGVANLLSVHGLGLALVGATGNVRALGRLCRRLVDSEARGAPELIASAVTEPSAGTDAEHIELLGVAKFSSEATRTTEGYVLNGRKVFISNGNLAKHIIVLMPTDRHAPATTLKAFWVDSSAAGFSVEHVEAKMGQRACPAAALLFEDCLVPSEACLGSIGGRELDLVLGSTRSAVAAYGAGIIRCTLEATLRCARTTKNARGTPLIDDQWVKLGLADIQRDLWQARSAYWVASAANEQFGVASLTSGLAQDAQHWLPRFLLDSPSTRGILESGAMSSATRIALDSMPEWKVSLAAAWGASAKLSASDAAVRACERALELTGGRGLRRDTGLEKLLRDARLLQIYEGSNELNRLELHSKTAGEPLSSRASVSSGAAPSLMIRSVLPPLPRDDERDALVETVDRWLVERTAQLEAPGGEQVIQSMPDSLFVELVDLGIANLTAPLDAGGAAATEAQAAHVIAAMGRHLPALGASVIAQLVASSFTPAIPSPSPATAWHAFPLFDEVWAPAHTLRLNRESGRVMGRVPLVVNAGIAEHIVVPICDGTPADPFWGRFPRGCPGVKQSPSVETHGLRGMRISDLEIDAAAEHFEFGELGAAGRIEPDSGGGGCDPWVLVAGLCVGILEASASLTCEYAEIRVQGGRTIVDHDAIASLVSEVAVDLSSASSALLAMLTPQADEALKLSLMLGIRLALLRGTDLGIQALGGYGYLVPYLQEGRFRDARQACAMLGCSPRLRLHLKEALRGPR